jgi:hypothetical protein
MPSGLNFYESEKSSGTWTERSELSEAKPGIWYFFGEAINLPYFKTEPSIITKLPWINYDTKGRLFRR